MNCLFEGLFCQQPLRAPRIGRRRHSRSALLLALMILIVAPSWTLTPGRSIRVLMLFFGDKDSPALADFQNGIRQKLEHELNSPVWIYAESFDEGWLGENPSYARTMETFLRGKYAKRGIDIVIPVGEYPLQFIQARRKRLFNDAKLLYVTVGRAPLEKITDATGMVIQVDFGPTVDLALVQNPGTKHVLLIAGSTAVDRGFAQIAFVNTQRYLQERHRQVELEVLPPGTISDCRKVLAALPPDTVSVMVSFYGDAAGEGFVTARILPKLSAISSRPIYGWATALVGHGIVGGHLIDLEANGRLFGGMVARVVQGDDPGTIPEQSGDLSIVELDWKQMKRWGIPMNTIPLGSTVTNREFTVWELYRWQITGLICLIVFEALLIASLIRSIIGERSHARQLAYRRRMEALIASCAAAFINVPPELAGREIEVSLQRVLEFFDLDKINLFEFWPGTAQLRLMCSVSSTEAAHPLDVVDLDSSPWIAGQLMRGTHIVVARLSELPDGASGLRELLSANGIRSFAAFPLVRGDGMFGTLSFATVRSERPWEPDLVFTLRTIADVFGSAMEQQRAEKARERHEQAVHELGGRLITAQEQERSRIARELHDDINQQVAVLAIELQQLKVFVPEESSEGIKKVDFLWEKIHELSMDIQRLSHRLHSTKLDHLGLAAALRGLCKDISNQLKIEANFQARRVPTRIDSTISLCIFRIAQESLQNILKHSRAQKAQVELFGEGDSLVLRVSDDGVGFDSDGPQHGNGLGMISMNERIRSVGGELTVSSKPSRGTQIEAKIPLPLKVAAEATVS